jgi:hypothetical protein
MAASLRVSLIAQPLCCPALLGNPIRTAHSWQIDLRKAYPPIDDGRWVELTRSPRIDRMAGYLREADGLLSTLSGSAGSGN